MLETTNGTIYTKVLVGSTLKLCNFRVAIFSELIWFRKCLMLSRMIYHENLIEINGWIYPLEATQSQVGHAEKSLIPD